MRLDGVTHGLETALPELVAYQQEHAEFIVIGERMQVVWQQGLLELRS